VGRVTVTTKWTSDRSNRPVGADVDLSHIAEPLRQLAVPVADLVPDPANARRHPQRNLDGIAASLRVYGQRKPVVVNRRTGAVEAGSGTLEAARALGWTHLAAVYVDDDPATAAGFAIADNRTAELAEWDAAALDRLLREASTGNDEQLDSMFAELAREEVPPPAAPPDEFGEYGEDISTEHRCPKCGYVWSGKPA
jgi:ParB-like nuclease domain